ncbi:benzylsuccinate CoA-transferase BbsF subunit [Yoonia maritima]|uniref:Benzylsuccinate CoA-transferase BbsF subunit n=1 Tax=Yoonia maritima TaxID=1435347 RepID=A0A2T0VVD1_9RHOB|nr:CoA transferase [Yoonia maritima]PRY75531.1 benzylsuccinate CoA-transferase BbsF subunit [Yoonia maritima]
MTVDDELPLEGMRVIDLTSTIAGPTVTRHLADFGAEVIKIETAKRPDIARLAPPYAPTKDPLNRSGYFAAYNAGKRSMAVDLSLAEGRAILRDLVMVSDVLVEAFRPGVMARLGLTYDVIHNWNPRIVMASHSLQGQTGPRATLRGFGHLSSAATGWFDITGEANAPPVGPYSAYTDFMSWPVLLSAIMLALEVRDDTGEGSYIDHAHVDTSAYLAAPELLAVQWGIKIERDGNHEEHVCPNNAYRCRGPDAWCAITVETERDWTVLGVVLGLAPDNVSRYKSLAARKADEQALDKEIEAYTCAWNAAELADALSAQGVAASKVYLAEDLFAEVQLSMSGAFRQLKHDDHGNHAVLSPSFQIDGMISGPNRPFPSFDADSDVLCQDLLGYDATHISTLRAKGALG